MARLASLIAAALLAVLLPVTAPTGASAGTPLPIGSVRDVVVDTARGKVFMSGSSKVAVADATGRLLTTITGFVTPAEMTLSADGDQVYVVDGSTLAVVDAETSTVVGTASFGEGVCPGPIAPASGKVFFLFKTCGTTSPAGVLGALDLETEVVTTGFPVGADGYVTRLAAIPGQPDALAANLSDRLAIIDTTGGETPTASVRVSVPATGLYFYDLAVSTNGAKIFAGIANKGFAAYSSTDLTRSTLYPTSGEPDSVAVRADGVVLASSSDHDYGYLRFYKPGATKPFATKRYDDQALPGRPAFGAKYLYGIVKKSSSAASSLEVITPGPPASLTLTTDRSLYPWRGDATVVATLSSPTTSRRVQIYIKAAGGSERLLRSADVNASSRKLVVTVPDLKVNTTFRAAFSSDGTYDSATTSRSVKVAGKVTLTSSSTSTSGIYHRLATSGSPAVSGQLYATPVIGCVQMIGYRLVSGSWQRFDSIGCVQQTSTGRFSVRLVGLPQGSRLKITARFQGSTKNAPSPAATYYVLLT